MEHSGLPLTRGLGTVAPEKVEVRGWYVPIKLHKGLELQILADSASEVQLAKFWLLIIYAASRSSNLHFSTLTFKGEISKRSISKDKIFLCWLLSRKINFNFSLHLFVCRDERTVTTTEKIKTHFSKIWGDW